MRNEGQGALDYGPDYSNDDQKFTIDPETKSIVRCSNKKELDELQAEEKEKRRKRLEELKKYIA